MNYKIEKRPDGSNLLTISGRLDTLSAAELEKGVRPLAEEPGPGLEIAIPELSYISSSGLRCFVLLFNGCKRAGVPLTVTGMQPSIREIFDLTGFSKVFGL